MSSIIPCFDKVKDLFALWDFMYVHTHAYMHTHTSIPAHATYTHACTYLYTHTHTCTMYTCIHMCTIQVPHTYMYTTNASYIQGKRRNSRKTCEQMDSDNNLFLSYTHEHFLPYTIKSRRQH